MKATYFLLGSEAIQIYQEEGFEVMLESLQERNDHYQELIGEAICISRDSNPEELMETICGYTEYLEVDKEMYEQINKVSYGENLD
jgi:hypothetical protein